MSLTIVLGLKSDFANSYIHVALLTKVGSNLTLYVPVVEATNGVYKSEVICMGY